MISCCGILRRRAGPLHSVSRRNKFERLAKLSSTNAYRRMLYIPEVKTFHEDNSVSDVNGGVSSGCTAEITSTAVDNGIAFGIAIEKTRVECAAAAAKSEESFMAQCRSSTYSESRDLGKGS